MFFLLFVCSLERELFHFVLFGSLELKFFEYMIIFQLFSTCIVSGINCFSRGRGTTLVGCKVDHTDDKLQPPVIASG